MQDAQGRRIKECGSRIIDIEVAATDGAQVVIREKFAIAKIESVILSLGRLIRWGWSLGCFEGKPAIEKGGHVVPIKLRRNTLMITAAVSAIAARGPGFGVCALSSYDDLGRLPEPLENVASRQGWHILENGLPVLVAHKVTELDLERSLWDMADWSWVAVFIRIDKAVRPPQVGDVWAQVLTLPTEKYEEAAKTIAELDEDLDGARDVVAMFHVAELPRDILSRPLDVFEGTGDDGQSPFVPAGGEADEDDGGGAGIDPYELEGNRAAVEGRDMEEPPANAEDELDGIALTSETPLKTLKELCDRQGLSRSGGKEKVLRHAGCANRSLPWRTA